MISLTTKLWKALFNAEYAAGGLRVMKMPQFAFRNLKSPPSRSVQPPLSPRRWAIDSPSADELVYQHGFDCEGWVYDARKKIRRVEVYLGEVAIGSTEIFYDRPDVAKAYGLPDMLQVGFTVRCSIPEQLRGADRAELRFHFVSDAASDSTVSARRAVRFSRVDYRQHGHGTILTDAALDFLKREQVYGSGPPSPVVGPVCLELVTRYLPIGIDVLDVGCGIGAWCNPLTSYGVRWTGCETRRDFVDRMLATGMRAVGVEDGILPFEDGTFDETICIEVLEHVPDHESFLAQVARVSKRGGLFSVPNFAAIPVTSSFYALPWHMLESDHKNFFTVRSLENLLLRFYATVETFEYGPLPQLRSLDGLNIKNHVFAIARH